MSRSTHRAPVFAALGDETRLSLLARLSKGPGCSITQLTDGTRLTRQAITKHLGVLERAGMVRRRRAGRKSVFEFDPQPLGVAREFLAEVSEQWDQALARLQSFVESDDRD